MKLFEESFWSVTVEQSAAKWGVSQHVGDMTSDWNPQIEQRQRVTLNKSGADTEEEEMWLES